MVVTCGLATSDGFPYQCKAGKVSKFNVKSMAASDANCCEDPTCKRAEDLTCSKLWGLIVASPEKYVLCERKRNDIPCRKYTDMYQVKISAANKVFGTNMKLCFETKGTKVEGYKSIATIAVTFEAPLSSDQLNVLAEAVCSGAAAALNTQIALACSAYTNNNGRRLLAVAYNVDITAPVLMADGLSSSLDQKAVSSIGDRIKSMAGLPVVGTVSWVQTFSAASKAGVTVFALVLALLA